MKQISLKNFVMMSCLIILATLPVLAQNEINRKPLQDFAANLNQKLDIKEVDLEKPFSIILEGYITEQGQLDRKRSKFTKAEGDEKMIAVAKQAIEAIGDSQLLSYLRDLEMEKIILVLSQDDKQVSFSIKSELPTVEKAKTISAGFNTLFNIAKIKVKEDEAKTLLNATNVSAQDKNCIIQFAMPKYEVHRL